jgi:hypothetical protein
MTSLRFGMTRLEAVELVAITASILLQLRPYYTPFMYAAIMYGPISLAHGEYRGRRTS